MKRIRRQRGALAACLIVALCGWVGASTMTNKTLDQELTAEPIVISGPEQSKLDPRLPDGGLPPVYGVQNFQVFRATRVRPDLADGLGWTYNHHVDMACWKGRLYVAWESGKKDEDIWPGHEMYSTSRDGAQWTAPAELFPTGVATPLRTYFFHAPNGRMLALAGYRIDHEQTTERRKGPLVVREIHADHSLGPIYTLRVTVKAGEDNPYPTLYHASADRGFVTACDQLLANRPFLEQQDYGNLLDTRGMIWHDPSRWPQGRFNEDDVAAFGKAMSFYHRKDGRLVAIGKKGWVTVSADAGDHWSQPVIPASLVTGMAKVWGQLTSDGRYALVYNPKKGERFPLVVVTGEDGAHFKDMRVVHGEVPLQRYQGRVRDIGPQYIRGISEWASDGSRHDRALWLVYSMNEEDIWVSRIPLPIRPAADAPVKSDLESLPAGPFVTGWNTYSPKWAPVTLEKLPEGGASCLRLEDQDPYDYARATRLFPESSAARASFAVYAGQSRGGSLEIEMSGGYGDARPIRLVLAGDGLVSAVNGDRTDTLLPYSADRWLTFAISADASRGVFTVSIDGKPVLKNAAFAQACASLQSISFRTGSYRGVVTKDHIDPETDRPTVPAFYRIRRLQIGSFSPSTRDPG